MNIGQAIEQAKNGERIARHGWNTAIGAQYVYYVPAASYPATTDVAKAEFPDGMVPYRDYLALKTTGDDIATWAPSCSDALANDWTVVQVYPE